MYISIVIMLDTLLLPKYPRYELCNHIIAFHSCFQISSPPPPRQSWDSLRNEPVTNLSQGAPALGLLLEPLRRDALPPQKLLGRSNASLQLLKPIGHHVGRACLRKRPAHGESRVERERDRFQAILCKHLDPAVPATSHLWTSQLYKFLSFLK